MNNPSPRRYCEVFCCIETETQVYLVNGRRKILCPDHAAEIPLQELIIITQIPIKTPIPKEQQPESPHDIAERLNKEKAERKRKHEKVVAQRLAEKQAAHHAYQARFKPCQFDGSKNLGVELNGMKTDWVRCYDCNCTGPVADGEDDAIAKWNQRPGQTEVSAAHIQEQS